jgi:hypothetical protein
LDDEKNSGIHIGDVGGDIIGVDIKGSGNIVGKNIIVKSEQLQKIPTGYADSLQAFTDALNREFKANNVPPDKVAEVQNQQKKGSPLLANQKTLCPLSI